MPRIVRPAALALMAALLAGCARATPRSGATTAGTVSLTTTPAVQARTEAFAATTSPSAVVAAPSSPPAETMPTIAPVDAATAARDSIEALIGRTPGGAVPDETLWQETVAGGTVIQVITLAESAGRAEVAVALAFSSLGDTGAIAEPIGLRVLLHRNGNVWVVDGIGYLA